MLEKEIAQLGLSDKEARVYLASLELGPSPVQIISQKSKVNRATTYVVIDSLMEMGLMSTFDEGKKTYFAAERPGRLWDFLKNQESDIRKKIHILEERMPELNILFNNKEDRPVVKYFEGIEGLRSIQMDFINTLNAGDEICAFVPLDDYLKTNLKGGGSIAKKRAEKRINMKVIYSSPQGRQLDYEKREGNNFKEYLYIEKDKFPFHCGLNVWADKILMIDYLGKMGGVVVENRTIADMFRLIFKLIWAKYKIQD